MLTFEDATQSMKVNIQKERHRDCADGTTEAAFNRTFSVATHQIYVLHVSVGKNIVMIVS